MIVYPNNWGYIFQIPTQDDVEQVLFNAVAATGCSNLCLSGGVDSSLTLHFMAQLYLQVHCFTIGQSMEHPDIYYSKMAVSKYANVEHHIYIPSSGEVESNKRDGDLQGDNAVRLLFGFIARHTDNVVSSDCIDELDCGYYKHQEEPTDDTFRRLIADLEELHLKPLDRNSGSVKVFLPYADENVVNTLLRIPLASKVDQSVRKNHIMLIASRYLPPEIIDRRKYGFCSALEPLQENGR